MDFVRPNSDSSTKSRRKFIRFNDLSIMKFIRSVTRPDIHEKYLQIRGHVSSCRLGLIMNPLTHPFSFPKKPISQNYCHSPFNESWFMGNDHPFIDRGWYCVTALVLFTSSNRMEEKAIRA